MYAESGKYLKNSTGMQNDRQVNYIITNKELLLNTIYIFSYKITRLLFVCNIMSSLQKKRLTIQ